MCAGAILKLQNKGVSHVLPTAQKSYACLGGGGGVGGEGDEGGGPGGVGGEGGAGKRSMISSTRMDARWAASRNSTRRRTVLAASSPSITWVKREAMSSGRSGRWRSAGSTEGGRARYRAQCGGGGIGRAECEEGVPRTNDD